MGGIGKSGLGYVSAILISPRNKIRATVRFYVDTGASKTLIADKDAERLEIDYDRLRKTPYQISGVGGVVDGYLLPGCMLVFRFTQSAYIEYLNNILVLRHNPKSDEEGRKAYEVPNLLGIDVLKDYTVRFTNKSVALEK